jgi:hypothetical protein
MEEGERHRQTEQGGKLFERESERERERERRGVCVYARVKESG